MRHVGRKQDDIFVLLSIFQSPQGTLVVRFIATVTIGTIQPANSAVLVSNRGGYACVRADRVPFAPPSD